MNTPDMVSVSLSGGKYTIVQDATGRTKVNRYGEEWRDVTGDNVILAAAYEIDALRARVKRLEDAGDKMLSAWLMPEDSMDYSDWVCLSSDAKRGWHKAKEAKP